MDKNNINHKLIASFNQFQILASAMACLFRHLCFLCAVSLSKMLPGLFDWRGAIAQRVGCIAATLMQQGRQNTWLLLVAGGQRGSLYYLWSCRWHWIHLRTTNNLY